MSRDSPSPHSFERRPSVPHSVTSSGWDDGLDTYNPPHFSNEYMDGPPSSTGTTYASRLAHQSVFNTAYDKAYGPFGQYLDQPETPTTGNIDIYFARSEVDSRRPSATDSIMTVTPRAEHTTAPLNWKKKIENDEVVIAPMDRLEPLHGQISSGRTVFAATKTSRHVSRKAEFDYVSRQDETHAVHEASRERAPSRTHTLPPAPRPDPLRRAASSASMNPRFVQQIRTASGQHADREPVPTLSRQASENRSVACGVSSASSRAYAEPPSAPSLSRSKSTLSSSHSVHSSRSEDQHSRYTADDSASSRSGSSSHSAAHQPHRPPHIFVPVPPSPASSYSQDSAASFAGSSGSSSKPLMREAVANMQHAAASTSSFALAGFKSKFAKGPRGKSDRPFSGWVDVDEDAAVEIRAAERLELKQKEDLPMTPPEREAREYALRKFGYQMYDVRQARRGVANGSLTGLEDLVRKTYIPGEDEDSPSSVSSHASASASSASLVSSASHLSGKSGRSGVLGLLRSRSRKDSRQTPLSS